MLNFLDYMYENYVKDGKGGDNGKDTTTEQLVINMDELAQKVAEKLSGVNTEQPDSGEQSDSGGQPDVKEQPDAGEQNKGE